MYLMIFIFDLRYDFQFDGPFFFKLLRKNIDTTKI